MNKALLFRIQVWALCLVQGVSDVWKYRRSPIRPNHGETPDKTHIHRSGGLCLSVTRGYGRGSPSPPVQEPVRAGIPNRDGGAPNPAAPEKPCRALVVVPKREPPRKPKVVHIDRRHELVARLADIAQRVWKGEIRGMVYAVVDRNRSIYPRWYLISSPDCRFDNHMPSAMAARLAASVEREIAEVPGQDSDPI